MKRTSLYLLVIGFYFTVQSASAAEKYLIGMKSSVLSTKGIEAMADIKVVDQIPEIGVLVAEPRTSAAKSFARLERSGQTRFIEKNGRYHTFLSPNDSQYAKQTYLSRIEVPKAWDQFTGNEIVVAVTDTGVDLNHPDLKNRLWTNNGEIPGNAIDDDGNGYVDDIHGWDFAKKDGVPQDEHMHGTHVAGIIGAEANNGQGIAGVHWNVKIMAVRGLDKYGSGTYADLANTIIYAAKNGAKVINASWGGPSSSDTMKDAINFAAQQGALFVAAAGNSSANNDKTPSYPAAYDSLMLAVASSADFNELSSFSSYGPATVDVVAPGSDIYSTVLGGKYKSLSGTSMATPHVVGLAALVWSYKPELSLVDLRNAILQGVNRQANYAGKVASRGEVSAFKAISQFANGFEIWPSEVTLEKSKAFQFTAHAAQGEVSWATDDASVGTISSDGAFTGLKDGATKIRATDSTGNTVLSDIKVVSVNTKPSGGVGACGTSANNTPLTDAEKAGATLSFLLPFLIGVPSLRKPKK